MSDFIITIKNVKKKKYIEIFETRLNSTTQFSFTGQNSKEDKM